MALATYTDLQTAIQTWLVRVGDTVISSNAADIIALAEAHLNRNLPLNRMRTDTTLTGTSGLRTLALPADFYEPISLKLTTYGVETLLKPRVAGQFEYGTVPSVPDAWCINGSNIDLDCPCNQVHTFSFRYRQKFALSDSSPTNWLLTNYPDAYLEAALWQAERLTKSWTDAALRKQNLDEMLRDIADQDAKQVSVGTLSVDLAIAATPKFNVYSGT